jgi:regulator of sigma E protease
MFALSFGAEEPVGPGLELGEIRQGTPADGQLELDDRIVSVDGVRADHLEFEQRAERLREEIDSHQCAGEATEGCVATTPARIVVERDGRAVPIVVRPEYSEVEERNLVGFGFGPADIAPVNPSVPEAAERSLDFMWFVTSRTVSVFVRLVDPEVREQVSGVVGSYEVTRQAINFDARVALTLLAVISLSLAIINLFPFLPLDGGHIFWSLVEKVRGRPVSLRVMEKASFIGFALIMLLFVLGLSNDLGRLGEGIQNR